MSYNTATRSKGSNTNWDEVNILKLLDYTDIETDSTIDELLSNEFIVSLAKQASANRHFNNEIGTEYLYLTDKQYNAFMKSMSYSCSRSYSGNSDTPMPTHIPAGRGLNIYHNSDLISYFDLPFDSGLEYSVKFINYTKSDQILIKVAKKVYRIIKLPWMVEGDMQILYKRTKCKGFLKLK